MQGSMSARSGGFTLIELVIAIAVVGLLVAIAYPSYVKFIYRSNRTDATQTLTSTAQALERCYSQTFNYKSSTCPSPASTSPQGYYTLTRPASITTSAYTLVMTPVSTKMQAKDVQCQSIQVNNQGTQYATDSAGNVTTAACWGQQ